MLPMVAVGILLNVAKVRAVLRALSRSAQSVILAWSLMFVGLGVFFGRSTYVLGVQSMDQSAWFQIACFGMAGLVLLAVSLDQRVFTAMARLPLLLLAGYGLLGVLSATYSPAPIISAYKGLLIWIDVFLAAAAIAYLRTEREARVSLETCYFFTVLLVASALLGAIVAPAAAFRPSTGVIGTMLQGSYPFLNPNELGFLGAVVAIVSLNRMLIKSAWSLRLYWISQFCVGLIVLVLSQARTSLLAFIVCSAFLLLATPGRRWIAYLIGMTALAALLLSVASSRTPAWIAMPLQIVADYAERGQTDRGLRTIIDRIDTWLGPGLSMIRERPLLGHGYDAGVRYGATKYGLDGTHMHNAHFQVLSNSGIVGYLAWLFFVVGATWLVVRNFHSLWRRPRDDPERYSAEAVCVMLIILIRTLTGSVLVTHQFSLLLFLGLYVYVSFGQRALATRREPALG